MPITSRKHGGDPILVNLGAAIRRMRLELGISQEELADRCQIDRSYLSSIEGGRQNPGVMSVTKIAYALELTLTELAAEAQL